MTDNKHASPWNLYSFDEPQRIIAIYYEGEPIYFDCCQCLKVDAVMYGFVATKPQRDCVAMMPQADGSHPRPAYYCKKCFEAALKEHDSREQQT